MYFWIVASFSPTVLTQNPLDLTLYIQTRFLSYGCDKFLRIYSRGERYGYNMSPKQSLITIQSQHLSLFSESSF